MTTRTVTPVSPRSADPRKYLKTVSNTEGRLLDGVRFYDSAYSEPASCPLQPAAPPSSGSGSRPDCRIRDGDSNRCTNIFSSSLPTFAALLINNIRALIRIAASIVPVCKACSHALEQRSGARFPGSPAVFPRERSSPCTPASLRLSGNWARPRVPE